MKIVMMRIKTVDGYGVMHAGYRITDIAFVVLPGVKGTLLQALQALA